MQVVPVPDTALLVGNVMPYALRDAAGTLLLAAGAVIDSESMRQQLIVRGTYVNASEAESFQRALADKMNSLLHQNASLGRMARAKVDVVRTDGAETPGQVGTAAQAAVSQSVPASGSRPSATVPAVAPKPPSAMRRPADPLAAWQGLALRAGALLHDPPPQEFVPRLQRLDQDVQDLLQSDPDAGLLVLLQNATGEVHQYSVNHALLVSVVCELAARELPDWPVEWRAPLRWAALTMNIAMTSLQDQLALQVGGLSARQRVQVETHAPSGAALLATLGVDQPLWLEGVARHHSSIPGPLGAMPAEERLARLIQRADIFAARLSPRKLRPALSATAAAKVTYLDERQQPDEAGMAIIKALGIYPPGSCVQLASNELAVVLRRGVRASEPRVASLVGRSGTPLGEPAVRDTRLKAYEVKASVAPKELRVRVPVARLLQLAG